MTIRVFAVGRPKLGFAREGVVEYARRIKRQTKFELDYIRPSALTKEGQELIDRSAGSVRIALDEHGETFTTAAFSDVIAGWQKSGVKSVSFLIGGADGHSEELRSACNHVWALSRMTLQHELALVVLLEQIYRAFTILDGAPYHRE
jgi:23S rRNA (pseudouridine1915-N3)-methyltransferase